MHALPPRLLIAFMCLSLADCSTANKWNAQDACSRRARAG